MVVVLAAPAFAAAEWRPHMHDAAVYARHRDGRIGFAVRTRQRAYGVHARRGFHSASVIKAMLLVTYLNQRSVRRRPLTHAERRLLAPMIRRSDNAAASEVFRRVGAGRLRRLARRAGMRRFTPVTGLWGLSLIDAEDQARYFLQIDRLTPRRHRAFAMRLLATVIPAQRWGVARVRLPAGWRLYFKGGWGSGTGAVENQVALLVHGERRVSLAILTHGSRSHLYAERTLEGIARRLLRGLH